MTTDQLAAIDITELDPTIFGGPVEQVEQDKGNFPVTVSYCIKGVSGTSGNQELPTVKEALEYADTLRKRLDYSISFYTNGHSGWGITELKPINEEVLRELV